MMPEFCEEQADCLKGIDFREWPERCYACGHASAQAQAKETKKPRPAREAVVGLNNLLSAGWLIEWKRRGQHKSIYVGKEETMRQKYISLEEAGYKKLKATELFKQPGT